MNDVRTAWATLDRLSGAIFTPGANLSDHDLQVVHDSAWQMGVTLRIVTVIETAFLFASSALWTAWLLAGSLLILLAFAGVVLALSALTTVRRLRKTIDLAVEIAHQRGLPCIGKVVP